MDVNGTLYGTTDYTATCHPQHLACGNGTVFSISAAGKMTTLYRFQGGGYDGAHPYGGLTNVNGTLYGTTYEGGGSGCSGFGCGTVYSITTSGSEKVLYSVTLPTAAEPFTA